MYPCFVNSGEFCGSKGISRFGTGRPNHVPILKYLAQMYQPAGQTQIFGSVAPILALALCGSMGEVLMDCQHQHLLHVRERNHCWWKKTSLVGSTQPVTMKLGPCWWHLSGWSSLTHPVAFPQRAAWARFLWSHLPANILLFPCNCALFCTPHPQYWGHFSLATWPHGKEHPPLGGDAFYRRQLDFKKE